MPERWRTSISRELVQAIRRAGGRVQKIALGRLLVTGPTGQVAIPEPETRAQLQSSTAAIAEQAGLVLS